MFAYLCSWRITVHSTAPSIPQRCPSYYFSELMCSYTISLPRPRAQLNPRVEHSPSQSTSLVENDTYTVASASSCTDQSQNNCNDCSMASVTSSIRGLSSLDELQSTLSEHLHELFSTTCTDQHLSSDVMQDTHSLILCWLGGSVVKRRSLIGELSLVCTGPAADG